MAYVSDSLLPLFCGAGHPINNRIGLVRWLAVLQVRRLPYQRVIGKGLDGHMTHVIPLAGEQCGIVLQALAP